MTVRYFYVDTSSNSTTSTSALSSLKRNQPTLSKNCHAVVVVNKKRKEMKRKSVSFQKSVSYRRTISLNEYTKEEIDACWISKDEFKTINADIDVAVDLLLTGNLNKEDAEERHHCRRGLEYQTPKGELRRNRLQMATREVVLGEQDIQFDQYGCIIEPFLIAVACQSITKSAIEKARSVALRDELEARIDL